MSGPFATLSPLKPLMDRCVHCGFCLPTCPSYLLLAKETDSPRGRIYLMAAGLEERAALSPTLVGHFDTCLGCMACETACPSGVRYGPLIEETRAAIERHHERPAFDRIFRQLLFAILPHPARLGLVAWPLPAVRLLSRWPRLMARLPAPIRSLIALAPARVSAPAVPAHTPAVGVRRLRVGLVTGCVQRVFFAHVNAASVRLLAEEGSEVVAPPSQGCCGALALHAGRADEARNLARALIRAFDGGAGLDQIVINAAGCGSAMKAYGELLAGDPAWAERARAFAAKVKDITETLAGLRPYRAIRHPVSLRVAYHDACHLAHAQGVRREPRELLDSIPGVVLVPLPENDICCGSAGIFNLVEPEMAQALGRRKAEGIAASGAELVVTSNPGCLLQIDAASRAAGQPRRVVHLVELLDASIHRTAVQ